jgi:hypothetical protein
VGARERRQDGCVASWISAFLLIGYLCAGKPLEPPFLSMSLRHQPVANAPSSGGHVMRHGVGVVSGAFTGTRRPSPRGQAGAEGTSDGCGRNKTCPRSGPFVDRIRAPVFLLALGLQSGQGRCPRPTCPGWARKAATQLPRLRRVGETLSLCLSYLGPDDNLTGCPRANQEGAM